METEKKHYKYIFKFIVVGSVAVGKSSIINNFINNKITQNHLPTLCVDLASKIIEINSQKIKLIIWDTAGSEAFHSLTRSYYRAVSGIFLIYDITNEKSFEKLQYWLNECKKESNKNVSIFLIGNKSDLESERRVTKAEAKIFADKNGLSLLETSAKNSENVMKAFLELSTVVYRKIEAKEIDVFDKESGARLSEEFLNSGEDFESGFLKCNDGGGGKGSCCK